MIVVRWLFLPFRLVWGLTAGGTKAGYRVGRFLGYRRMAVFGVGVGVGLLVAPTSGRELRRKLQEAIAGPGPAPSPHEAADLADRVRQHVRQAPRTWHLPQPVVTEVSPGVIRLDGEVADESARRDLQAAAEQVEGVQGIDDRLRVAGASAAATTD